MVVPVEVQQVTAQLAQVRQVVQQEAVLLIPAAAVVALEEATAQQAAYPALAALAS